MSSLICVRNDISGSQPSYNSCLKLHRMLRTKDHHHATDSCLKLRRMLRNKDQPLTPDGRSIWSRRPPSPPPKKKKKTWKFIVKYLWLPWTPTRYIFYQMKPHKWVKTGIPREDSDGKLFKKASCNFFSNFLLVRRRTTHHVGVNHMFGL